MQHTPTPAQLLDLERDAWRALTAHGNAQAIAAVGLSVTTIGSTTAVRCRAGGPLLNQAFGAAPRALAALRTHYEEAGVAFYFVHAVDATPDELAVAGLARYRRRTVYLTRPLNDPSPPIASGVSRPTSDEMLPAAEIYCAAFDVDRSLAPVFASVDAVPGWHRLVARVDGVPVGVGILYARGELAMLFGGATAPAYRRRGVQAALVNARIVLARELGCTWIGGRTGEPVPDDPQHSFRNMMRAGLSPIGTVDVLAPPGIVWSHGRR